MNANRIDLDAEDGPVASDDFSITHHSHGALGRVSRVNQHSV
jgi:hypothetical protein